jgi:hypothetical protein
MRKFQKRATNSQYFLPLQIEQQVEPREESGDGGARVLNAVQLVGEQGQHHGKGGQVQHPGDDVEGVQQVLESLLVHLDPFPQPVQRNVHQNCDAADDQSRVLLVPVTRVVKLQSQNKNPNR